LKDCTLLAQKPAQPALLERPLEIPSPELTGE
jgi:hypothetical protein